MNSVEFKIYKKENETNTYLKTYVFELNKKIIDIKNTILNDFFKGQYNYIELSNITERVYKDYGLLFFDKGLIPPINDNYTLEKFTIPNRTFSFVAETMNKELSSNNKRKLTNDTDNYSGNNYSNNYSNKYSNKYNSTLVNSNTGFLIKEEDFPPLH
jgi:hypothetical protein